MLTLSDLRVATMNARARTGTPKLGTEVLAGRLRVTVQCREGRRVAVIPAGPWDSLPGVIAQLDALQCADDVSTAMARAAIARI